MKLDFLKEKQELVSIVLLGFSAIMAVFIFYRIIDFSTVTARAENVVKTAIEQNATESQNTAQYSVKDREIANNLTRNNPFALPAALVNPVTEVRAIFGNQALINNRWYSEGDEISGNAKIVTIEPMQVIIEWNGRETSFRPLDASIPEPQQSARATARAGSTVRGNAEMTMINGTRGTGQMTGRRGMVTNMDNMRTRFQNMSDAERERLRNEMRQQFGGRGGGFFDQGGGGPGGRGGGPGGRGGGPGGGPGGGRGGRGGRG
jgi:type II secretory pathway component PulC